MKPAHLCRFALVFLLPFAAILPAYSQESHTLRLAHDLGPLSTCLMSPTPVSIQAKITLPIDGQPQEIQLGLVRGPHGEYELSATQKDYAFLLHRTETVTAFVLPRHQVAFVGKGKYPLVDTHRLTGRSNQPAAPELSDHLAAKELWSRLISAESSIAPYVRLVLMSDAKSLASVATGLLKLTYDAVDHVWVVDKNTSLKFLDGGRQIEIRSREIQVSIKIDLDPIDILQPWSPLDGFNVVKIDRPELERQLVRGVRRATEILSPAVILTNPPHPSLQAEHGELRWVDGHRVCLLSGTPEQIGTAHGQLLYQEARKTIDSVLYTFGTANTIRTGRWFRHDLEEAYKRLAPHIPEDHKRETSALALALGIDEHLAQTLNVFPELFHCSGFAVFGSATKNGKLYHGRVLDYMTTIGLQDAATTFIVSVEGKIPFANVGYAGFIGSVTGMNDRAISLGEMGGRGEGQWDGVPMATLMRRALEECSTLQEVKTLWSTSPRTCEYYYVFADGKTNAAVGVAATPESIEFIEPGQGHERLGTGIPDAVVLSAGSRLEKLRERVQEKHGQIDIETAIWLMSRPVAMKSNLHNALFIPADGILYVANADHTRPAAERPYVRLDLKELLKVTKPQKAVSQSEAPSP